MARGRLAAVGAFVIGGVLLFAVGLFMIGSRRMLFGGTFKVYAEFASIAGLENGALVRVAGLQAGEVETIQVPASPSGRFRVRMRLRDDVRPLVRVDSVASIQNDGLVGNKFIQIEPGSEQAPVVTAEGTIQSREPFDIADLMDKMNETIDAVNNAIVDVKGELDGALRSIAATADTAKLLIDDVGRDARAIVASGEKVAADLQVIVANVKAGRGTVGQLLNDDALYQRAKSIAADAEKAMANVRAATDEARAAIADLRGKDGPVQGLTGDLRQTLTAARDVMSDLAENTEALKRNFLFRGYFNRRGYFDLDDISPEEYRRGALESPDRKTLRIWLRADVLFERDADGEERLSEGGKARLNSAMSMFVKYPKSPFVVEGYAPGLTGDERFLGSRRRAVLVRDYLVTRFEVDPNLIAIMPLGNMAEGSPSGDTWDGVGLAVFVPISAL
jgi:phospholipid/cholesterol/gamma-HCH transport system substrate-binding protein